MDAKTPAPTPATKAAPAAEEGEWFNEAAPPPGMAMATAAILVASAPIPEGTETIKGYDFNSGLDYDALLRSYLTTGAQASHFGRAVQEINRMISWRLSDEAIKEDEDEDLRDPETRAGVKCTIWLSFTSNMVSTGVREIIRFLVQHKYVDIINTTAGAIEEDFMKCMNPHYVGSFHAQTGVALRKKGHNRIGNMLVPNQNYCEFEDWIKPILDAMLVEQVENGTIFSPSTMIARMGKEIDNEDSVWYWCQKNDIPVFCPGLTDGSVGDMLYFHSFKHDDPSLILDTARDIRRVNDLATDCKKSGMIILGGGTAKHHTCNANLMRNGADFSVFVNVASEYDCSDSGAPPDEAISWGKIKIDATPVKVVGEATLIFPLLVAQTFAKKHEANRKKAAEAAGPADGSPLTLTYFGLFAKGPAIALALEHSGLAWKGAFPGTGATPEWGELKPTTPWGHVPTLEVPGVGTMGHELSILSYIAGLSAEGSSSEADKAASLQLMGQAEDIFGKLGRLQDTIFNGNGEGRPDVSAAEAEAFWTDADASGHNKSFGLLAYLGKLEAFAKACTGGKGAAFTASGVSAGECKLFAVLHTLVMIEPAVLAAHPALEAFYAQFAALPGTQVVLDPPAEGGKLPGQFKQYFVKRQPAAPLKLKYFDARGAGEVTRLVFAAAGKMDQLDDARFASDFSKYKDGIDAASPEFAAARDSGELSANMNRAPVMVADGVSIGQSSAIERLVARRFGLYGTTDIESALIDAIGEHLLDIKNSYQKAKKAGDEDKAKWFGEELPAWMLKLEAVLGETKGFAVGEQPSVADAKIFIFVTEYFDDKDAIAKAVEPCAKLSAISPAFKSLPSVAEYLSKRKETPM